MDGWVEKIRGRIAVAKRAAGQWLWSVWKAVASWSSAAWNSVKDAGERAGRFVSNHFIKFFLVFWLGASAWVFSWVVDLANPCRGTNLVCPGVEWIRPGYLAEDFRNLLWAASLVFGGAGAGAALINALRRTRLMQAEHGLAQRGQDAETFSRAVDQLGNEQTAIRLGAIYALEGLMRSAFAKGGDKAFGRQIGETLAAFVRDQSAKEVKTEGDAKSEAEAYAVSLDSAEEAASNIERTSTARLAVDREAAVVALARSWPFEHRPRLYLDLGIDLSETRLDWLKLPHGADLRRFDFSAASLRHATLERADLEEAWLDHTDLESAKLIWANLRGAALVDANIRDTKMFGADVSGAAFGLGVTEIITEPLAYARWLRSLPPVVPFSVLLPHRGDGKANDDSSPFDESWMRQVGPAALI